MTTATALGPDGLIFGSVPVMERPLFERLAPVRNAGFTGLSVLPGDLWALAADGITPEEAGRRIRDEGLAISEVDCTACWLPSQRDAPAGGEMRGVLRTLLPERGIEIAHRVGARSVTAVEFMGVTPSLDEAAEAFATLCDMGADHGLLVHLEFLPFGGIPNLTTAWSIVEAAGRRNGGLTIDSWHLFRSGSTLEQLRRIPGDRVYTVQIDDAPVRPWDDMFAETMTGRLLPGEGAFNLVGLIQTLDAIGCTAPIEVETFNARQAAQSLERIAEDWSRAARDVIQKARGRA